MDTRATYNLESGTSKPESQLNNGDREFIIPSDGNERGVIDPALARSTAGDNTGAFFDRPTTDAPKRRGRPPGSGKNAGSAKEEVKNRSLNINGVEKILFSVHEILAAVTQTPELNLTEDEAKKISQAVAGVTDQYIMEMSPKTAAYVELTKILGVVYGPRAVSYYLRKKMEAPKRPSATVTPIRPQPQEAPRPPVAMSGFDPKNVKLDS